jgi:hypothetical protein
MKTRNASPKVVDKSFFLSGLAATVLCLVFWYAVYKLVAFVVS